MCVVSDKIKFCSCPDQLSAYELPQYWVLYRKCESEVDIMGTALMPDIDDNRLVNENAILKSLQAGNSFDKDMHFEDGDRLMVVIKNDLTENKTFEYYFEYKGRKWKKCKTYAFEIESEFSFVKNGYFIFE